MSHAKRVKAAWKHDCKINNDKRSLRQWARDCAHKFSDIAPWAKAKGMNLKPEASA